MSYPTGVVTRVVNFGKYDDFEGGVVTQGTFTFTASTDLYHAASGDVLLAGSQPKQLQYDGTGWIVLPTVNQSGFVNAVGSAVTNWTYQVTRSLTLPSGETRSLPVESFQLWSTDPAEVDLETLVKVPSSGGVIFPTYVTSVNTRTGAVTGLAETASPTFTGVPAAPTAAPGTSTTQLATTAFVAAAGTGSVPDATTSVKGKLQLAGDLAGTAAAPTVPGLALKAPLVSLRIALAKTPDSLISGTIVRNSSGVVTSAAVVWPDNSAGTYTTDTIDASGAINAYHITYGSPVTATYTQPAVTRDSSGNVTTVPQIVVT